MIELEQIYKTYFKAVFLYAMKLTGNEYIAEEITSETFLKAINSIDKFRGDCNMRAWLCQIVKNTYLSYLKKNKRILSIDDLDFQNISNSGLFIETKIGEQEEIKQTRILLHQMPDPYKEVFMWRVFGELSFKEIGNIYGKTDNWACVTYHRAKKMIQSRLEEIEYEK